MEEKAENRLEILIAIFLGITALLTAWATWIGSLHGGNQATNYTKSNNVAAEGNSMYNEASQQLMQDMITWNTIMEYRFDAEMAEEKGDKDEADLILDKIDTLIADNCSENFYEAIQWADKQKDASPFEKEGYVDSYYEEANNLLAESQELLKQGQNDNTSGDRYGLVTVIFS